MDLIGGKWSHYVLECANMFSKAPCLKALLKPIYYPIKQQIVKAQTAKFTKNGLQVLQRFDRCLEENNIEYTLAFGTLLGAVREKGFIKHDSDIDVCIWASQYTPKIELALKSAGFELVHTFMVGDGHIGREDTYECDGVDIDIFYLYEDDGEYPYCCDFSPMDGCPTFHQSMRKYGRVRARRVDLPISKDRVKTPFENIELYIPSNAHDILRFRYGDDYMIPNPAWGMGSYDKHIHELKDHIACYYRH